MPYFVYILYSEKFDKFYIGQTDNHTNRLNRHNAGFEIATKPYIPWKMIWLTDKKTRADAMKLEKKLKNLSKKRIRLFIEKYK